ncbi:MAG: GNAT family N-acetyltransferase [Thioalkalivibrio sp.]|nr:GNAT family N-acetyltransferase [Thioalkalivibrio sp.]
MAEHSVIRDAGGSDLDAVNAVVEAAIHTWKLPERVKRLALPLYRYTPEDLAHLQLRVLEKPPGIIAVAACEPADPRDLPGAGSGMLLHGLYVDPARHRQGLGARLLGDAAGAARDRGHEGILVRAQADAEGFFAGRGFRRLPVRDAARDYAARLWLPLS